MFFMTRGKCEVSYQMVELRLSLNYKTVEEFKLKTVEELI